MDEEKERQKEKNSPACNVLPARNRYSVSGGRSNAGRDFAFKIRSTSTSPSTPSSELRGSVQAKSLTNIMIFGIILYR